MASPRAQPDQQDVRSRLERIDELQREGQHDQAVSELVDVAAIYAGRGVPIKAVAVLRQAVRIKPEDAGVRVTYGDVFERLKMVDEAAREYLRACDLLVNETSWAAWLEVLKRLVALDSDNLGAQLELAEAYSRAGHADVAAALFRTLAGRLLAGGDTEDWERVCERLLVHDALDLTTAHDLALHYARSGRPAMAIAKLAFCYEAQPDDVELLELIVETLALLGQTERAAAACRELVNRHRSAGLVRETEEAYKRLYALAPDDPEAREALGVLEAAVAADTIIELAAGAESVAAGRRSSGTRRSSLDAPPLPTDHDEPDDDGVNGDLDDDRDDDLGGEIDGTLDDDDLLDAPTLPAREPAAATRRPSSPAGMPALPQEPRPAADRPRPAVVADEAGPRAGRLQTGTFPRPRPISGAMRIPEVASSTRAALPTPVHDQVASRPTLQGGAPPLRGGARPLAATPQIPGVQRTAPFARVAEADHERASFKKTVQRDGPDKPAAADHQRDRDRPVAPRAPTSTEADHLWLLEDDDEFGFGEMAERTMVSADLPPGLLEPVAGGAPDLVVPRQPATGDDPLVSRSVAEEPSHRLQLNRHRRSSSNLPRPRLTRNTAGELPATIRSLGSDLKTLDFFIERGFYESAVAMLRELEKRHPNSDILRQRRTRIERMPRT